MALHQSSLDVAGLDDAIAIARTWPAPGHIVEVRACVDHSRG